MAEKGTGSGGEGGSTLDSTLQSAEENLASLRRTLEAIEGLETRWKAVQKKFGEVLAASLSSAYGVELPCTLTEEEKLSVFEGKKPSLEELCRRLKERQYRKVIVMVGAGVSVSAGIPDFRSPNTGLYHSLDLDKMQLPSPQAVFDINFFRSNPKPFFSLWRKLFHTQAYKPTITHHFIRLLSDKGLLHRCYSQNIDGLERRADIPINLLVEAHGTCEEATCTNLLCKKKYTSAEMSKAVEADNVPKCRACDSGIIKPDIVFFGEDLPPRFKELLESDFEECDLLLVIGTSLQVQPFCSLTQRVKQTTPRLLVNKERVGSFTLASEGGYRDVAMLEECDQAIRKICHLCDWTLELEKLVKPVASQALKKQPWRHHTPSQCWQQEPGIEETAGHHT